MVMSVFSDLWPHSIEASRSTAKSASTRPVTANGVVFVSLEDESGVANAVIMPDVLERDRTTIVGSSWLLIEGPIQDLDGVIHVRATRAKALSLTATRVASQDFR
jgi:error-prone DNA polymerase